MTRRQPANQQTNEGYDLDHVRCEDV
jgi:hypothetical protein